MKILMIILSLNPKPIVSITQEYCKKKDKIIDFQNIKFNMIKFQAYILNNLLHTVFFSEYKYFVIK